MKLMEKVHGNQHLGLDVMGRKEKSQGATFLAVGTP
jgi:hypothetical protein